MADDETIRLYPGDFSNVIFFVLYCLLNISLHSHDFYLKCMCQVYARMYVPDISTSNRLVLLEKR